MKVVVITTINEIENLYLIRERCPGWTPIVAGDLKSPHDANRQICKDVDGVYLDPETQMKLGFTHAAAIPWNCYGRKNIAYLFALKEGAKLFFLTDDDNVPIDNWALYANPEIQECSVVNSESGWYNCYEDAVVDPPESITPRGYPSWLIAKKSIYSITVEKVRIGVIAGLHLGSPDVDAATRISKNPRVLSYPEKDVALNSHVMCPYDSQNTIIVRELMPANMLWSFPDTPWTRYDDIFSGYVGQVIAWKYGFRVRYGRPFVFQERNPHDFLTDLQQEINGMAVQRQFIDHLRKIDLKGQSPAQDLQIVIYELLRRIPDLPRWLKTHVDTWINDLHAIGIS